MSKKSNYQLALVIDDSEMDRLVHKVILLNSGFAKEVITENSGTSALSLLEDLNKNGQKLPDLILLDLNMPILNGFEFLQKFEKLPDEIQNATKIIIISSSEDLQDIEDASAYSSVVGYLVKPINIELLNKI